MKDTMILKDSTVLEIEPGSGLLNLQVVSASKEAMLSQWDKLTDENLKEVQIKNGEGAVVGEYTDLILNSETSEVQEDGTILTTYSLRQKTEVELLRERVKSLEEGQEIHDGAIMDVAAAVSSLAEAQEGGTV